MGNPFFNALCGNNPMQMLMQLKNDPVGFLAKNGFNIPKGANNPQDIIQGMLNNGQISQQQINQAKEMARRFGMM